MRLALILALGLAICACSGEQESESLAPQAATPPPASSAAASSDDGRDAAEASPAASEPADANLIAEDIAYGETEERNLTGYMVLPADAVDVPGVILLHEWFGLNDDIREKARRLAGQGYAVLAVDLYDGNVAANSAEADALIRNFMGDPVALLDNIRKAHSYLDQFVLAPRIGIVGWAHGGGWSLESALELGNEVDAVVSFYGRAISDPGLLGMLDAPLLGIYAGNDDSMTVADVQQFRGQLRDLDKDAQILIYPDVRHGFANRSGSAFNAEVAEEAWGEMLTFLEQHLR